MLSASAMALLKDEFGYIPILRMHVPKISDRFSQLGSKFAENGEYVSSYTGSIKSQPNWRSPLIAYPLTLR